MFKPRSRFGRFLDKRGVSQEWISKKTKISRNTISKMAADKNYSPNLLTIKKIMKAIKEIDPKAKVDDFFDM
jgi:predicted transcriptional regulator